MPVSYTHLDVYKRQHIGFDVEDIEQYSKLLEKHQVEFTVKLKRLEDFNCRVLFFKDPNGIEIELFEED